MFDPFYSTKGAAGTGLGASIVYGVARAHDGLATVDSTPGRGTTVSVYLPAATAPSALAANGGGNDCETILIVDDMVQLRQATRAIVERAGYRALTAASGEEALERLAENGDAVGLVLLDCALPGISGRAVFDAMRERGMPARVLFVSGYTRDTLRGLSASPDWGFLPKPFDGESLLNAIGGILDGAGEQGSATASQGSSAPHGLSAAGTVHPDTSRRIGPPKTTT